MAQKPTPIERRGFQVPGDAAPPPPPIPELPSPPAALAAASEAAVEADAVRWRQEIRLRCLEATRHLGTRETQPNGLTLVASVLEHYVLTGEWQVPPKASTQG